MGGPASAGIPIPKHIDWFVWRIVTSEKFSVQPWQVEREWTLDEVLDAHEALDLYHDLDVEAANRRYLEAQHRRAWRG